MEGSQKRFLPITETEGPPFDIWHVNERVWPGREVWRGRFPSNIVVCQDNMDGADVGRQNADKGRHVSSSMPQTHGRFLQTAPLR